MQAKTSPTTRSWRGASTQTEQASAPPLVEVRNLKILNTGTALKATCSIRYGDTTTDEVKIIWVDGKEPFVSPPQLVSEYEGRRTYTHIIRWAKPFQEHISAAVLSAYYQATGQRPYAPLNDEEAF